MSTDIENEKMLMIDCIGKSEPRELTFGEKLVGLGFNPSGDPKVTKAKQLCAELADLLNNDVFDEFGMKDGADALKYQLYQKAVGDILDAQMNVVKVLTFKY
jgi:hypothetical protein